MQEARVIPSHAKLAHGLVPRQPSQYHQRALGPLVASNHISESNEPNSLEHYLLP
jgi:hypothetical protein